MNPAECGALAQDLCESEKDSALRLHRRQNGIGITTVSISSLALSNFRNYQYARLEVDSAPVVLVGENGAGKTNILEAISLLSAGRGLRRAKLSEIDSILSVVDNRQPITVRSWAVSACLNGKQGEVRIGTGRDGESVENSDKRIVKIDGKIVKGQAELSRHVSLLWLTPQMEQLFSEGASAGRKFLDRLVFGFDGEHAARVNEYEYAMRERNKILQMSFGGRGADTNWLSALEQTMAENGAAIAIARLSTCEHINHTILLSTLSFPKARVDVVGFAEDLLKKGVSALDLENEIKNMLESTRARDAAAGRAIDGVHRSEFSVVHLGKNMPAEKCSMGEQKAMMISIVLAQARSGERLYGVVPLLLLDEAAGHLDEVKRSELFEEIISLGAQCWMTGTDAHLFAELQGKAQFLAVAGGVKNMNCD